MTSMKQALISVVIVVLWAIPSGAEFRPVDCTYALQSPDPAVYDLYAFAFRSLDEDTRPNTKWPLIFESYITLGLVAESGVDLTEFLVTLRSIENQVSTGNVSIATIQTVWSNELAALASKVALSAQSLEMAGNTVSAASAYMRAWAYLQSSERFADHLTPAALATYSLAIQYFQHALLLQSSLCSAHAVPYISEHQHSYLLHAYWCAQPTGVASRGTAVVMTGFDGSAELSVFEVALGTIKRGYNVMVFEGPGQGSVARFQRLLFRADWDFVTKQVVSYVLTLPGVNPTRVMLWGVSFGGYLAPRGFVNDDRVSALVANGGVADMFQATFCRLPGILQSLFYTNYPTFAHYVDSSVSISLGAAFTLNFATLGFNITSLADLFVAFQPYYLTTEDFAAINHRPVLVYDPALDMFVGNASQIFYASMSAQGQTSAASSLLQLSAVRGAAMHCAVGSTSYARNAMLDWVDSVYGAVQQPAVVTPPSVIVLGTLFAAVSVYAAVMTVCVILKRGQDTQAARLAQYLE